MSQKWRRYTRGRPSKILPGTGRGTATQSVVVVGAHGGALQIRRPPSTSFAGSPPRSGEDLMKLAVTGGTGFVGSHLIDAALAAGHEVKALTRRAQEPRERVQWISGSLDDRDALKTLVEDADAVIHVAGVITAPDEASFEQGNVTGTLAMLAAATAGGVRRFVHVSSLAAREPKLSL